MSSANYLSHEGAHIATQTTMRDDGRFENPEGAGGRPIIVRGVLKKANQKLQGFLPYQTNKYRSTFFW